MKAKTAGRQQRKVRAGASAVAHTRAPWFIVNDTSICARWETGEIVQLASLNITHWSSDSDTGQNERLRRETEANGPLMAAAPRLLKELKHLVRLLTPLEDNLRLPGFATLNGARGAIAEATAAALVNGGTGTTGEPNKGRE